MSRLAKLLLPWYKEKDVTEKEQRVSELDVEATSQISRAQQVVRSYREASIVIASLRK